MMYNFTGFWFLLTSLVWLAVVVYVLILAGRFVTAVERIADNLRSP